MAVTSDLFQGLNIDKETLRDLYTSTHQGLRRTGASVESFCRAGSTVSAVASTSANAQYTGIVLPAGTVVSNITFFAIGAATTPTHQLAGLYSSAFAQLATSADGTSTAIGANGAVTFAMTTPYTVTADGLFYAAVAVVSGGNPTWAGVAGNATLNNLAPAVCFGDSSNTISTALPATATQSAGVAGHIWAYVS